MAGYFVSDLFNWRVAYFVGGGLGLILLVMRMSVYESGMFAKVKSSNVKRGNFFQLFATGKNFFKYLKCILIGVPVWYVIGIIVTLAPEFAKATGLNIHGEVNGGRAVMFHYIGASTGAFLTGMISQRLRSRKKALLIALISLSVTLVWFFLCKDVSAGMFYFVLLVVGIPNGYWSVFIANSSEQFGTNLRSTVTTTTPNIVRGTTFLMTTIFTALNTNYSIIYSAAVIGIVVMVLAIISTLTIEESFHKDLDYVEEVG